MKQKIYIETTIPSFYHEIRTDTEMVAMRKWTQNWWNNQRHHYDLVTSIPVIEELENGSHPSKQATLELISKLPILPIHDEIQEIVEEYVTHHIMNYFTGRKNKC